MELNELCNIINGMNSNELDALYETIKKVRVEKYKEKYDGIETMLHNYFTDLGKRGYGLVIEDGCDNNIVLCPSETSHNDYSVKVWHKEDDARCDELDIPDEWRD